MTKPQIHKTVAIIVFGIMLVCGLLPAVQSWCEQSVFNHMSPADHLREAKANSLIPGLVFRHLAAIPQDASEYKEVPALMQAAREVEKEDQLRFEAEKERFSAQDAQEQRERAKEQPQSVCLTV